MEASGERTRVDGGRGTSSHSDVRSTGDANAASSSTPHWHNAHAAVE